MCPDTQNLSYDAPRTHKRTTPHAYTPHAYTPHTHTYVHVCVFVCSRAYAQRYAASEGWPADQTYVYGDGRVHIKHPIGAALQATNTVTGETKTTGISTCDPDAFSEDATVRQAFLTGQQIEYAREVGWPTNNTVLQFTGDIRLPKKRRYVRVPTTTHRRHLCSGQCMWPVFLLEKAWPPCV